VKSREQQLKNEEIREAYKELFEVLKEVPKDVAKALPALAIKGFTVIVFLFFVLRDLRLSR
jgi:hypothetical protein